MVKYKYNSLAEFKKDYPKEFNFLAIKKLLKNFCDEMGWEYKPKSKKLTLYECKKISLKFETRRELIEKNKRCYTTIKRNKWQVECFSHMKTKKNNYWTKERCVAEANKFHNISSLVKNNSGCYDSILRNKWQSECFSHMCYRGNNFWTFEKCLNVAKKFETITQLRKSEKGCYNKIIKNKWGEKCFFHMKKTKNNLEN